MRAHSVGAIGKNKHNYGRIILIKWGITPSPNGLAREASRELDPSCARFLGYRFDLDAAGQTKLSLAAKTLANHERKLEALMAPPKAQRAFWARAASPQTRLYEQYRRAKAPIGDAITDYIRRWRA